MGSLGDSVLLEGAIDSVTAHGGLAAEGLIGALAVGALKAGTVDPLDADLLANLDILNELTAGDDDACALVAADKGHLGGKGPVAHHGVQVGVADTRELDVDENLIRSGGGDGDLLVVGG